MGSVAQLLVVSPDRALLQAARRSASSLGHAALLAAGADEAQRMLTRIQIDLICLDSLLPEEELARFWRWLSADHARPTPPLILLAPPSASMVPAALPAFFQPERDALVPKPLEGAALAREIARLLAARPRDGHATEMLRAGSLALDSATRELLFAAGGVLSLTPTEFRLLRCLMERAGEFVSPEELLEQVWGYPPGTGGAEVVRAHVSNLRRKLRSMGEDPQLLRSIPYRGYGLVVSEAALR